MCFSGVSDSEIVDPSMEEQGDSLKASDSEEEPSNSEEELSDSEKVPDSEQSGTTSPYSLNQNTSAGILKLSYTSFKNLTPFLFQGKKKKKEKANQKAATSREETVQNYLAAASGEA